MKNNKRKYCCSHRIVLEKTKQFTWIFIILAKIPGFFIVLASDYWK
jgi:hypothetical protein